LLKKFRKITRNNKYSTSDPEICSRRRNTRISHVNESIDSL